MSGKLFTQVQNESISSNTFDLSHDRKLSCRIGDLVPINLIEVIPGDKFSIQTSQMLRFAPLVAPVMHQSSVYTHYFFVPNRILWSGWEDFITGGPDGMNNSVHPYFNLQGEATIGSLWDYMGIPTGSATPATDKTQINALPFAAYNKIYNEYYRDENLVTPLTDVLTDGAQIAAPYSSIQKRAWQHDYFTSSLPWTQKGPEATIPLGTTAPILFNPDGVSTNIFTKLDGTISGAGATVTSRTSDGSLYQSVGGTTLDSLIDNSDTLLADLSQATASTIIDLRRAFKLQEFLEKNARGGSRYIETIMSHFGVRSSDARLQRPEFLGGNSAPMQISEVLQTAPATDAQGAAPTPQGNMAGHGISVGGSANINYKVEEHGFIIGIQSFLPKSAYQQGLPKMFSKSDKFDYYWPSFAHIGEQPVYNKELYHQALPEDDEVFGYTPRYAEYKFINSTVHGEYRSTLDFWHMGRIFASKPSLNQDFIECDHDEVSRIFAVTQSEQLYCHVYNKIKATRKMPFFGSPKM
jgi:hypothetical protein